ncbi:sulfate adenylyltransferase subunit CysD [Oscillatoria amoena NRMC-F 0135]|nr:sulfate adenylyltransferase subunit CysD [Oscillatoria laete-virens]MDL5049124.1 sulfate adenylyltransferase subunit CysD [Oscillatoria amoena NRMC-F 0135]MDL5053992.1 sulfate adenylyltransferase subunit CysD [Oscillatoria laete-virens NRMC-F 0139]
MSSYLQELENQSIYIMREAWYHFHDSLVMPYSMGKDSSVLLWLAKKAFFGHVPFPLLHIDTSYEFPEMYEFREHMAKTHNLNIIVKRNEDALARKVGYEHIDPETGKLYSSVKVTEQLKTLALKQAIAEGKWRAMITGVRKDEDPVRAKERFFSPRNAESTWDVADQPPELWGLFSTDIPPEGHMRVQPLLDWTETNIWEYIKENQIPIPSLYFSREGKRFRSLGCHPITHPVKSNAATIDDIIEELKATRVPERAGRAQDHEKENAMESLRLKGFF